MQRLVDGIDQRDEEALYVFEQDRDDDVAEFYVL